LACIDRRTSESGRAAAWRLNDRQIETTADAEA
jgi:hypothetical protein